jgi:hypothetical protein
LYQTTGLWLGLPTGRNTLRKYRRSSLLLGCARLSVAFNFGPEASTATNQDVALRWIPVLFPQPLISRIREFARQERVIFFQGQLRFLASEIMRLEPYSENECPTIENDAFGELLLRAAELLYQKHPEPTDPLDKIANEVSRFLPIYEIDSPTDAIVPLLRFCSFLRIIIPRLPEHLKIFDVEALFEKQFGFCLKLYTEFIFAFAVHAVNERHDLPVGSVIDAALRVSWFKHTVLASETIKKMFESVSFALDDLAGMNRNFGYADFDYLRDHPYFLFEEALYCLDYEFSFGKLESGVLWRVLRGLPNSGDYLAFWGSVFEHYVGWLFDTYASERLNRVYLSPAYTDDPSKQICDVIVICGGTAILIEAKLATCASSVRYSGDYKKMKDYLESRLVSGENGAVGVGQLLNAVHNLATLSETSIPAWLSGIRKIIPLIITKDDIGSMWKVNQYLNTRFEEQFRRKDYRAFTITPLVSMSVATLERAIGRLNRLSFSKILEDRIRADRDLQRPFEAASTYVGRGQAPRLTAHLDILNEVMAEVAKDFDLKEEGTGAASAMI